MEEIKDVVSVLNDLIEICKDGEQGFQTAAEGFQNLELRRLSQERSKQRAQFARELQTQVELLDAEPESSGSVTGALHRGWINIKATVTGKNEEAIIAECERGEDAAKEAYENAIQRDLPGPVAGVILRQYQDVRKSHDQFSALEKASKGIR